MDYHYFLDWCPTNTVPIDNQVLLSYGCSREISADEKPEIKLLFAKYLRLRSFDFTVRLDGVMLIRICVYKTASDVDRYQSARDIANIAKERFGHVHEFHCYAYGEDKKQRRKHAPYRMILVGSKSDTLSEDLHIDPVEIENPFSKEYYEKTKRRYGNLEDIAEPKDDDKCISQLRALSPEGKKLAVRRACLRLRALYAQKKDRCVLAFDRRGGRLRLAIFPIVYAGFGFLTSLYLSFDLLHIGIKTSLLLSVTAALGVYMFVYTWIHSHSLELLQRTIGFYAYANIYSKVTETIYKKSTSISFDSDTNNFNDIMNVLDTRFNIERQHIRHRQILMGILFAVVTVSGTMHKLATELERLTDSGTDTEVSQQSMVSQVRQ